MPQIPYERVIAFAAGPIAIVAGWLSTQIVQHFAIFGDLGLGQDKIAHAIVAAATFIVGAGVTYAAHHKWLSNLPAWWATQAAALPAPAELERPESARTPDAPTPAPAPVAPDPAPIGISAPVPPAA